MSNAQGNFNPFDAITARISAVGYDNLNDYEKGYYAVWWFVTEVNNGGLDQFFFNSSGGYLPEVRMGLRMMGATQTLGIFDRAIAVLGRAELPRDDAERRDIVLKLSPDAEAALDELTDEFYNSSEDLSGLGEAFVVGNLDKFVGG